MIKQIVIERFKSIEKIELDLEGINVLIGSNNSGKSSIQQAIQFAISVAQSSSQQRASWKNDKYSSSLSKEDLIYAPLRDIEALALNGKFVQNVSEAMRISFENLQHHCSVEIRKGKNKNIATSINGKSLGETFQNVEEPFSIIVPGLAGIPHTEEYKPPSIVRKAAAKGSSNSVFRNILLLLSEDRDSWNKFTKSLSEIFPNYNIKVAFDLNSDEYIKTTLNHNKINLPIDACGTGILQTIQILSYVFLYKPKLLILDEPDSHLHPDNQRRLAVLLKSIHEELGCQLLISTHSRHFFEALKDDSKVFWINNSQVVKEENQTHRDLLMEIGALEKSDLFRDGEIKCILLTEDSNYKTIKSLCQFSGFQQGSFDTWSYKGCTNKHVAEVLISFINKQAPSTKIIVHRDRDFMSEQEVVNYRDSLTSTGVDVFITENNDVEHYFINADHINHILPEMATTDIQTLIDKALENKKTKVIEKQIDTIYKRRLKAYYKGGDEPKAGPISTECNNNYAADKYKYMHGKIIEKELRKLIQEKIGRQVNLFQDSPFVRPPALVAFAKKVWGTET